MEFIQLTDPLHDVHVHDIVFDFYGKRFATCSTDAKIKIWDHDDIQGTWNCVDITDCHNSIIWRLSWAHPEFGSLIASCSEDRTVKIWEEQTGVTLSDRSKWIMKVQLSDSKKAVNDVKFAPRHLGLKVATASADGIVRIYEATDVFSLNYWQLQYSFHAEDTSPQDLSPTTTSSSSSSHHTNRRHSEHGLTCIAWNECLFEPPLIAVGGYSKRISIWKYDGTDGTNGKWNEELELSGSGGSSFSAFTTSTTPNSQDCISGVIHDIAWAPAMGRSYHLIAAATRECNFKIYTLNRLSNGGLEYISTHIENVSSPVWRIAWNATGTVLSTSSEDGSLRLWRKDFAGQWRCVQELPHINEVKRYYPHH